jgi:hypothetical protein
LIAINDAANKNYKDCFVGCGKFTAAAKKEISEIKQDEKIELDRINQEIAKLSSSPGLSEKISEENTKMTSLIEGINSKYDTQLKSLISSRNSKEKEYAKKSSEKSTSDICRIKKTKFKYSRK